MIVYFKNIFLLSFVLFFLAILFTTEVSSSVRKESLSVRTSLDLDYNGNLYRFWIKYFTGKRRVLFQNHMNNGGKYYKLVRDIFASYGLPRDLYYVGLIESGYNLRIRSRANAVGPWQFVKGTARRYGLKVNRRIDERKDIIKSTRAAARYFKDLYNIFGKWELALCAYNKGEYGMMRAIKRGNSRNYRVLARKRLIPKETSHYISKVAAARTLVNNYKKYRFVFNKSSKGIKRIAKSNNSRGSYIVKSGDTVYGIANKYNVKAKYLIEQNSIRNGVILVGQKLIIRKKTYRVRLGDNLSKIARKFGVNLSRLISYNSLKSTRIVPSQKLHIPL